MNFDNGKEKETYIAPTAILKSYNEGDIKIGAGSWIGDFVYINGYGCVEIGRCCGIGQHVTILTSQHDLYADPARPIIHAPLKAGKVIVKDGADIGAGCVILPGVTIGEGAMVGAGMVVREDVGDYEVVRNNPAVVWKLRKDKTDNE